MRGVAVAPAAQDFHPSLSQAMLVYAEAAQSVTPADDRAVGGIFNVGSDREITIGQLAERVRRIVNPGVEITHVPYEQAYAPGFSDLLRRVPDISKLRRLLGFEPTLDIDGIIEGVRDYIAQHGDR